MTDLIAPPLLRPVGSLVVSRGSNEYGDDAVLGMVVGGGVSEEGERYVTVLTDAPRRPRQPSLLIHHQDGKRKTTYENLGLVAHLLRLTESDINPAGTDDFRHAGKVWTFAIKALRAAAVPPGNRPGRLHDELIAVYHELRGVATNLEKRREDVSNTPAQVRHLPAPTEGIDIDREAVLKSLGLNPRDPNTHALLLVCERYNLDPLLKHIVLIKSNAYVTRDGYLAVAHRSGQFDGMEVQEQGENQTHYTAKVAVYRRDMSRPFAYVGRYPKSGQMAAQYGPEMAVKVAEVQALRRAFNVTGISAADEMWDQQIEAAVPPAAALDPGSSGGTAPSAPPAPFDESNEMLVPHEERIAFYSEMTKALPGMKAKEMETLRHAVVRRATKGRTESSKGVLVGEEWNRVISVFRAFMDGKLELVERDGVIHLERTEPAPPEAS